MENENVKLKNKIAIIITPNYKDYAKKYLDDLIISIHNQDYDGKIKIFITDNESSEESYVFLREKLGEEAVIIRNEKNDGYAKGCNDAIKKALEENFDYISLFNIDTILKANCISEMVKAFNNNQNVMAIQPIIMLWPEKEKINSFGNVIHFLGFGYCNNYNQLIKNLKLKIENFNICYPSGAGVLFKAGILKKIGLFDEEMWMYNEDEDLGWRIWLSGFRCILAPDAIMYHKYEFSRSIKKYYYLDRNRIINIIKNYHYLTLLLILPAFIVMEIGQLFFAFKGGWIKEKINVYKYFFNFNNWKYLLKARKESQNLRKVKDKDVIKIFSGKIMYQEIDGPLLRSANIIFNIYWKVIKFLIIW